jgi:hypothetical protein
VFAKLNQSNSFTNINLGKTFDLRICFIAYIGCTYYIYRLLIKEIMKARGSGMGLKACGEPSFVGLNKITG